MIGSIIVLGSLINKFTVLKFHAAWHLTINFMFSDYTQLLISLIIVSILHIQLKEAALNLNLMFLIMAFKDQDGCTFSCLKSSQANAVV